MSVLLSKAVSLEWTRVILIDFFASIIKMV